ncbi:MAG: hypothetical protein FWC36_05365 [Spirochaetes bacterium]|nr:hypothetical protein [Spirochaetota bacterium]
MKRFPFLLFFFVISFSLFSQMIDDRPSISPEHMTFFQNEMTSIIRHKSEVEENIPLFMAITSRFEQQRDNEDFKGNNFFNLLIGGHIKLNDSLFIPVFASGGGGTFSGYSDAGDEILNLNNRGEYFFGSGLFINTNTVKVGIYAGYNLQVGNMIQDTLRENEESSYRHGFKIVIAPLISTGEWAAVGNLFNHILGYVGLRNSVVNSPEDINLGLELAFHRINFDSVSINPAIIYRRGSYDMLAKNETYGFSIGGLLSDAPFAFFLEGGYMRFYSVNDLFSSQYFNTPYISAGFSYSFNDLFFSINVAYQYDRISRHQFSFYFSIMRFASLYFGYLNPGQGRMERAATSFGGRLRSPSWQR